MSKLKKFKLLDIIYLYSLILSYSHKNPLQTEDNAN